MAEAAKLKQCMAIRKSVMSEMTEILRTAIEAENDKGALLRFKIMFEEVDDLSNEFFKQHSAILTILSKNASSNLDEEDSIKSEYKKTCTSVKTYYAEYFKENESDDQAVSKSKVISHIRLPKLELRSFAGDYKEFRTYIDLFDSLIHNNDNLSDIEKFNYLISSLQGPPLNLVKYIPMNNDNYKIAYQSLIDRYSNKRLMAQSHWTEIEKTTKLTSESYSSLRKLLDTFTENLSALEALGFPISEWNFILVHMLLQRLPTSIVTRFELGHASNSEIPEFEVLTEFVNKHCIALDNLNLTPSSKEKDLKTSLNKFKAYSPQNYHKSLLGRNQNDQECTCCSDSHPLYKCKSFLEKTPRERYQISKDSSLCLNCLSYIHTTKNCKSRRNCSKCHKRHHTLLHFDDNIRNFKEDVNSQNSTGHANTSDEAVNVSSGFAHSTSQVLLSTLYVEVSDNKGIYRKFRCLLDSGSQVSLISLTAAKVLNLPISKVSTTIHGLNHMNTKSVHGKVILKIKPVDPLQSVLMTEALILSNICSNIPSSNINIRNLSYFNRLKDIKLADPYFYQSGPIDILLGADIFPSIIQGDSIKGNTNEPIALNTIFGYVIMGRMENRSSGTLNSFYCHTDDSLNLENAVKRFWELENIPASYSLSKDDTLCEQIYSNTCSRDETGRFIVALPFRDPDNLPNFENSRELAVKRFYALENRLQKQPVVYTNYRAFLREYVEQGHMSPISGRLSSSNSYYIPHHCVIKPDSPSTKLRVVFSANTRPYNADKSLNDYLLPGPKLQKDIVEVLLNFRLHNKVLCSDIQAMFRMILIKPEHRAYQRIVWRFATNEPLQDYELNTVTFGMTCSPFLAIRTLHQLVQEDGSQYPLASKAIMNDTYVDDIVTGCDSFESAIVLRDQLIGLLKRGGFHLRKWSSNDQNLLRDLPQDHLSPNNLEFDDALNAHVKILGLHWNPSSDNFLFGVTSHSRLCTKRTMLSDLARIFDPLGFLTPITFSIKYLIQRMWISQVAWDDAAPPDITRLWEQFTHELPLLKKICIPRRLLHNNCSQVDIFGFADASEKGYAAVVYFRTINSDGSISTYFIISKSKIAPMKTMSIPRLELCAAVLLSKLINYIINIYSDKLKFNGIFAFSDSQIALAWIRSHPSRWKTFISNRVAYIQEKVSSSHWYYVESVSNPADVASRGLLPSQFISDLSKWLHGPALMTNNAFEKGFSSREPDESSFLIEERKVVLTASIEANFMDNLIEKCSSLNFIIHVVVYVLRFCYNINKFHVSKHTGNITQKEVQEALSVLANRTQNIHFSKSENLITTRPFRKLGAFIDDSGIIRVGGRLTYSHLPYERKHPILLPSSCRFTELLVSYTHEKYFHASLGTVHYLLCQNFWILAGRQTIRRVLSKCLKCWKLNPRNLQPPMGNLPLARISQVKPFSHSGVDFAGPVFITLSKHRGVKSLKAYICIFICMATKAIHIELVSDMSTEKFLDALRRFIARRGRCSHLYSDCGTNFIGASKYLNLMKNAASREHIEWHFQPPKSPHFGGLWEAGVKTVKTHLYRVIGTQILTFEEMSTLLSQIESLLNSRPLIPVSSDPSDLTALTPGHFLTMEPLTSLNEADVTQIPVNRLSRWQLIQRLHQDFWKRWHLEYLHTLQQRSKWLNPSSPPVEGSLVLIKEDNAPPMRWSLGRIVLLHPGADGVARVARVKTSNGVLTRPLVKLCPLPLQ